MYRKSRGFSLPDAAWRPLIKKNARIAAGELVASSGYKKEPYALSNI